MRAVKTASSDLCYAFFTTRLKHKFREGAMFVLCILAISLSMLELSLLSFMINRTNRIKLSLTSI